LKAGATVQLDADTVARIGEILRDGLIASGAVLATEYPEAVQPAAAAPAKSKSRKRASSKKR
jgi:hypothetical protein